MSEITRSAGVPGPPGYLVGSGYKGATEELDAVVVRAGEMLCAAYQMAVTIRFNSDRESGGAWLRTHTEDRVGTNAEIGLCAEVITERRMRKWQQWADDPEDGWKDDARKWVASHEVGDITILAHISDTSLRTPEVANVNGAGGRRYVHKAFDSLEAALAFLREHAITPEGAQ